MSLFATHPLLARALPSGAALVLVAACGSSSAPTEFPPGDDGGGNNGSSGGGSSNGGTSNGGTSNGGSSNGGSSNGGSSSGGSSSGGSSSGNTSDGGSTSSGGEGGPGTSGQPCAPSGDDWPMFGSNICNTGSAPTSGINATNAMQLTKKWVQAGTSTWPATPAISGGFVYVGDEAGSMYKLKLADGSIVWQKSVATVSGAGAGAWSRTTPVVTADAIIFGVMLPGANEVGYFGPGAQAAYLVSMTLDGNTVNWSKKLESQYGATDIQQSPVYDGTNVYVGITSSGEAVSSGSPFIGSIHAINAKTGAEAWHTAMIDSAHASMGYAGASVWGSTPVVDTKRNQIIITTGNNYGPANAMAVPGNNVDSIVALDIATGNIKWAKAFPPNGSDVWTFSATGGPDGDFGSGPNLFTVDIGGKPTDIVGAGQKSGYYHALDPATGNVIWDTKFGPGGHVGGIHWGTSTDGLRVYAGVNNTTGNPWKLVDGSMTSNGAWGAMDAATGHILWQTAEPNAGMVSPPQNAGGGTVTVNGPVKVANGVVFGGAMDNMGTMYAFDAATGRILWHFASGGSVYGGPAFSGKMVVWGSGYGSSLGFGTPGTGLYAFAVP